MWQLCLQDYCKSKATASELLEHVEDIWITIFIRIRTRAVKAFAHPFYFFILLWLVSLLVCMKILLILSLFFRHFYSKFNFVNISRRSKWLIFSNGDIVVICIMIHYISSGNHLTLLIRVIVVIISIQSVVHDSLNNTSDIFYNMEASVLEFLDNNNRIMSSLHMWCL